jgi:hypothetical protein
MESSRYRKVNNLSEVDRAYIAGIIDGEGSVTLSFKQKGANRHLCVSISSTEKALLEYVYDVVSAGKIASKKRYKSHHSKSYTYAIYSRQAPDLLEQIVEFLRGYKKQRSQLALDKYIEVTPRNGKYSDEMKSRREQFVENFFDITA